MGKRKIYAILLIFLIYASSAGSYLNNQDTYDNALWLALINVAIISIVMVMVPLIFRIKNKRLLNYARGSKVCAYNSLISFGISVVAAIIFEGVSCIGSLGAIIYYFINMFLFCYPKNYMENAKNAQAKGNIEINNIEKVKEEKEKEPLKNSKTVMWVISILVVIIIGMLIYITYLKVETNNDIVSMNNEIDVLEMEISRLKFNKDDNIIKQIKDEEKAEFFDKNIVFVLNGYGDYYYTYEQVKQVTQGKEYTYWIYNIEAAKSQGYKPWK